ncbi:MAG: cation-translocating P-type ATPase [Actinomycetales bacterium]
MRKSLFRILLRQFTSPAILVLLVTAIIYGVLGNAHDALVLLAIIIPSGLLTFAQEFRAENTLAKLKERLAIKVKVLRNDNKEEIEIFSSELKVGDRTKLVAGDIVPADMALIESTNLSIDQSVLTGEAFPKAKSLDADSQLFMGTFVSGGSCHAMVTKVGSATQYGLLEKGVGGGDVETAFEKGIRSFGALVAKAIFFLVLFVFFGNLVLERPALTSLLFSLALAVGLTPQMLPVIISVCLSAGARRLASEKVLVRRLDAIEDLGTMEILCTDKTGTLTVGELKVDRAIDISGGTSERVMQIATENATLQESSANAIDKALIEQSKSATKRKKVKEYNFDFQRRIISILTDSEELITKGAYREVLAISSRVRLHEKVLPITDYIAGIAKIHDAAIADGYKVLAVASKSGDGEFEMIFEGFILITDPAKNDAKESVSELKALGVDVVLISGDSAASAIQIAKEVGIASDEVMIGKQLENISDTDLVKALATIRVFAEISPIEKSRLVSALRDSGKVVGFLGDGINDSLALKNSDVAISVDDASDVAKSASSVVLLEKNLAVIADGVRIGRKTFENTMKYVRITISASFGNVLSMAIASFFLPFLPMLPTQILLLNFLSDLPAIAISGDRVDDEDLAKPRDWTMKGIGHFMVIFGLISTAFDLTLFYISIALLGNDPESMRSSWFAVSLMTEVVAILVLRTRRASWRSLPARVLFAISILVVLLALAVPALGVFTGFGLPEVSLSYQVMVWSLVFGYAISLEIFKRRLMR